MTGGLTQPLQRRLLDTLLEPFGCTSHSKVKDVFLSFDFKRAIERQGVSPRPVSSTPIGSGKVLTADGTVMKVQLEDEKPIAAYVRSEAWEGGRAPKYGVMLPSISSFWSEKFADSIDRIARASSCAEFYDKDFFSLCEQLPAKENDKALACLARLSQTLDDPLCAAPV